MPAVKFDVSIDVMTDEFGPWWEAYYNTGDEVIHATGFSLKEVCENLGASLLSYLTGPGSMLGSMEAGTGTNLELVRMMFS